MRETLLHRLYQTLTLTSRQTRNIQKSTSINTETDELHTLQQGREISRLALFTYVKVTREFDTHRPVNGLLTHSEISRSVGRTGLNHEGKTTTICCERSGDGRAESMGTAAARAACFPELPPDERRTPVDASFLCGVRFHRSGHTHTTFGYSKKTKKQKKKIF